MRKLRPITLLMATALVLVIGTFGFAQEPPPIGPKISSGVKGLVVVALPSGFAQKYGNLLDLVEQLNAAQNQYLTARTPKAKSAAALAIEGILAKIIAQANELKENLKDNPFVNVPGFSIELGLPASFSLSLDFSFKPRKK